MFHTTHNHHQHHQHHHHCSHHNRNGSTHTPLSVFSTLFHPVQNRYLNDDNHEINNDNELKDRNESYETCDVSGIKLNRLADGTYKKQQFLLAHSLCFLPLSATYEQYQQSVFKLIDITRTRYDLLCFVRRLINVTRQQFSQDDVRLLNHAIRIGMNHAKRGVYTHRLEKDSFQLVLFTSVCFELSQSSISNMSFIIFLVDNSTRANWLRCASFQIDILECSNLHAQTYCLITALEFAKPLREEVERLVQRKVPLFIVTDSNELFRAVSTMLSCTSHHNSDQNGEHYDELKPDLDSIEQACRTGDIRNIAKIKIESNIAGCFQRLGRCKPLETLLDHGVLNVQVDEWLVNGLEGASKCDGNISKRYGKEDSWYDDRKRNDGGMEGRGTNSRGNRDHRNEECANNGYGTRDVRHSCNNNSDDEDAYTDELLFGTFVTAESRLEYFDEGTCSNNSRNVLNWRRENEGAQGTYNRHRPKTSPKIHYNRDGHNRNQH